MSDWGMSQRERQALDWYITGNYGEDQFKGGRMQSHSTHYPVQHPAVGAVTCPYCQQPKGAPCVTTRKRATHGIVERTETHKVRVAAYDDYVAHEQDAPDE